MFLILAPSARDLSCSVTFNQNSIMNYYLKRKAVLNFATRVNLMLFISLLPLGWLLFSVMFQLNL